MTGQWRRWRSVLAAVLASAILIVGMDFLTNSIDTQTFNWDFRYYLDMADSGLSEPLVSPFAYRYLTPLLVRGLAQGLNVDTRSGFASVAYAGAILQLLSVFLFTRWFTHSERGAWFALLAVAFSLFNVKFLIFDPFRPDHLAFPLILLQTYLALTGRFTWLLLATIVGCQIREFNAIPLLAYAYSQWRSAGAAADASRRRRLTVELIAAAIGLGAALILPRLLIPIAEDFQFATLTPHGILRVLLAPLIPARDANFVFSVLAYLLPVLMVSGPGELRDALSRVKVDDRRYLGAYLVLVLLFSFLGGTDFFRFSAYLLLPQAVLLGLVGERIPLWRMALVLAAVFVFNRIWLTIPMSDLDAYLDFYGAYGTRFNAASVLRIMEWAAFIGLGLLVRKIWTKDTHRPRLASA